MITAWFLPLAVSVLPRSRIVGRVLGSDATRAECLVAHRGEYHGNHRAVAGIALESCNHRLHHFRGIGVVLRRVVKNDLGRKQPVNGLALRVGDVTALRLALLRKLPEAASDLNDSSWNIAVNGSMVLSGEASVRIASGDRVILVPTIVGG